MAVYKIRALDTTLLWQPQQDPVVSNSFEQRQDRIIQQNLADGTRRYYNVAGSPVGRLFRHSFKGLSRADVNAYETMRAGAIGSGLQFFDCVFNAWIDCELTGEGLVPRWEQQAGEHWSGTIELLERL